MTKDEALRMAIEALENNKRTHYYCEDTWYSCPKHEDGCANEYAGEECNCGADETNKEFYNAIQACKEALAETQEPVHTNGDRTMNMKDRNFTSEGNGYIQDNNFDFDAGLRIGGDFVDDERDQYAQMICNALNTTPPIREWQSLSDEEIIYMYNEPSSDAEMIEFAREFEAKLRGKNNA